jgi:hypothetical protein
MSDGSHDTPNEVAMTRLTATDSVTISFLSQRVIDQERDLAEHRRLIRWLSLPYGDNVPIFHAADPSTKRNLEATYREALEEDDGDADFWQAAENVHTRQRPTEHFAHPAASETPADEYVQIDDKGNTI